MATISRRQFFRLGLGEFIASLGEREEGEECSGEPAYIRPPGAAADEGAFLAACERCGRCAAACPFGVIEHLGPAAGEAEGTPALDPESRPCRWCPTMDCMRACPSGALGFGPEQSVAPIARAVLNESTCLNQQGILCDDCAAVCPAPARAIRLVQRRPQLDPERCLGCGLCAFHCASTPVSIRILPL